MGGNEKFCLRWNDFESNISVAFKEIREEKDFFDCTLSVGDRQIQAHKLILSACSPFFRSVLRKNPHPHPLLYLKGVEFSDLQSVLNFMYHGEVNVAQEELNSFLAVAEDLKVKGLTQNNSGTKSSGDFASKQTKRTLESLPRTNSSPRTVPSDPPSPRRNRPTPQFTSQQDDEIQEVMPVVKTEPEVEQQQPSVTTYQQSVVQTPYQPSIDQTTSYPSAENQVVGGTISQMEDQAVYEEDDGYDYGGYEEGYGGASDMEAHNKGVPIDSFIPLLPDGKTKCLICDSEFLQKCHARRHYYAKHSELQQLIDCDLCGKTFKNKQSLKTHNRVYHQIFKDNSSYNCI